LGRAVSGQQQDGKAGPVGDRIGERIRALASQAQAVLDAARVLEHVEEERDRLAQELDRLKHESGGGQDLQGLEEQVARLSQENMELANRLAELEEMNSAMMNMYVSSYNLHASLDPERVVNIISEIVINFVGAEEFAILLRDEETGDINLVAGEGHESRYPDRVVPEQGVLGAVVASQEPFVHVEDGPPREGILAAVPLGLNNRVVGAVVIFKLLQQKEHLSQGDVELLHLLGTHAATALVSARQHARVDRKLKTLEGLMELLRAPSP
jgi:nitrate/nitrite-specific signal transduction histidine kinase